jgi:hypothetical protein
LRAWSRWRWPWSTSSPSDVSRFAYASRSARLAPSCASS